jgi:hypothetical protein
MNIELDMIFWSLNHIWIDSGNEKELNFKFDAQAKSSPVAWLKRPRNLLRPGRNQLAGLANDGRAGLARLAQVC